MWLMIQPFSLVASKTYHSHTTTTIATSHITTASSVVTTTIATTVATTVSAIHCLSQHHPTEQSTPETQSCSAPST